jgi:hypothetical protein
MKCNWISLAALLLVCWVFVDYIGGTVFNTPWYIRGILGGIIGWYWGWMTGYPCFYPEESK